MATRTRKHMVCYWEDQSQEPHPPPNRLKKGYTCWFYEEEPNGESIKNWMKENMQGKYECTLRFNSGDPMHTIYIEDDRDASMFVLKWGSGMR